MKSYHCRERFSPDNAHIVLAEWNKNGPCVGSRLRGNVIGIGGVLHCGFHGGLQIGGRPGPLEESQGFILRLVRGEEEYNV